MKSNLLLKIFAVILIIPLIALIFGGCSGRSAEGSESSGESSSALPESGVSSTPESSVSDTASAAESVPTGKPTFLIGMDGKAILTSEITRLEQTDKTAETLTKDDLYADVYCDGFTYVKEPLDIGYDTYNNPEMFNGGEFIGEAPENKNEWKRVYVGDEICGLKVKSAVAHFVVNDWYTFPESQYSSMFSHVDFEGSVEMEGFLQVTSRSVMYPDGGEIIWFYPIKNKLPIMPAVNADNENRYEKPFESHWVFDVSSLHYAGESVDGQLGKLNDAGCDMDGLGVGDVAYARVTIRDIGLGCGGFSGTLEQVELLSDILVHVEDQMEVRQPAPTL